MKISSASSGNLIYFVTRISTISISLLSTTILIKQLIR